MSARLQLDGIRIAYGRARHAQVAVDAFSWTVEAGDIGCLLGPSGCGKTSVLRAIAGFEPLAAGSVALGGQVLSSASRHLPPEQRRVGMMFQEYALFPHLTAAENVGFGLRRLARRERQQRIDRLLDLVGLPDAGSRFPHELSGGQQQRIALARALAPAPDLLLLDEPLSNLDAAMRERLALDVRDILKAAGQTAVLVTHSEQEAATMADHVMTMRRSAQALDQ